MEKTCKTCRNNVEYPPPHTCDICASLDAEEEYEMWQPKYSCKSCKYDELADDYPDDELPDVCLDCYDEITDTQWLNWTPKEESSLNGEFYLKLVCDIDGKEVEVSKIRLTDLVDKVTADMLDSFCKAIKMK